MARQFAALRPPNVSKDKRRLKTGEIETRWKVSFYDHAGKRRRRFFHSQAEAESASKIIQNQQLNEGIHASKISPGLREEAIASQKLLVGTGYTLLQFVQLGIKHLPKKTDKTVTEILEEFLTNRKTIRNNKQRTIDEYRCQLEKLAKDYGHRHIDSISADEIEKWLAKPHLDYKGRLRTWAGRRRNIIRGYISTLFNFAKKKNWCKTNPVEGVDKAIVERAPIEIWTPAEVTLILKVTARDCPEILAFLAIAFFSGVRTCELLQLHSSHIKLDQGIITVPAHISKTRKLRNVPISENLKAWLAQTHLKDEPGPIWGLGESSLHRRYRILEKGTGFKWKDNALRHCFATNHLALHDNEYLTARACGHSPKMLRDHYDAVVSKSHGRDHFNVFPTGVSTENVSLEEAA